ncbi:MAG: hypothetical protein GEU26_12600 [Nitrososphaeraceae archaeon]|nr:hypothetical protein [Nitrososphaeraceae archaeon]
MINRSPLSQKKIRSVILKIDTNTQTQNNLSLHFLYDHDKFNEVIEELIVATDKLDYPHYHYES